MSKCYLIKPSVCHRYFKYANMEILNKYVRIFQCLHVTIKTHKSPARFFQYRGEEPQEPGFRVSAPQTLTSTRHQSNFNALLVPDVLDQQLITTIQSFPFLHICLQDHRNKRPMNMHTQRLHARVKGKQWRNVVSGGFSINVMQLLLPFKLCLLIKNNFMESNTVAVYYLPLCKSSQSPNHQPQTNK